MSGRPTWLGGRRRRTDELVHFYCQQLVDQVELGPLLVLAERIAFLGRGKAALARQAQLVDVDKFRRLVDVANLDSEMKGSEHDDKGDYKIEGAS